MTFDADSKLQAIDELQAIYRNGQILELRLRLAGKAKLADQTWASTRRLGDEIDVLLGKAIDAWLGDAEKTISKINKMNGKVQEMIDDVTKTIKTAEQVVKFVGYIDDAVAIAVKLAKYV